MFSFHTETRSTRFPSFLLLTGDRSTGFIAPKRRRTLEAPMGPPSGLSAGGGVEHLAHGLADWTETLPLVGEVF